MVASTYDEALKRLLVHEGGYSNHPNDPGGPTNWGITIIDARLYWKPDATATDVRNMPVEVAKDIYKSKYWDKMRCDELPPGVDYAVFDFGVNSGVKRSAEFLQRIVGANQDGIIGDQTIALTRDCSEPSIAARLCDERLAFLQGLRTWSTFGKGWGRRVREVRAYALQLAKRAPKAPDLSAPKPKGSTKSEDPTLDTGTRMPLLLRLLIALVKAILRKD